LAEPCDEEDNTHEHANGAYSEQDIAYKH